jgi:hypothetical protein
VCTNLKVWGNQLVCQFPQDKPRPPQISVGGEDKAAHAEGIRNMALPEINEGRISPVPGSTFYQQEIAKLPKGERTAGKRRGDQTLRLPRRP